MSRSLLMQVWEDGAWLLIGSEPGRSPLVIAKGHLGSEPAVFTPEAGAHWLGEDEREKRRETIARAAGHMWVAGYDETRRGR